METNWLNPLLCCVVLGRSVCSGCRKDCLIKSRQTKLPLLKQPTSRSYCLTTSWYLFCVCDVSDAGSPWVERRHRRLPSPGGAHSEGGLSLSRDPWVVLQGWILQFALLLLRIRYVWGNVWWMGALRLGVSDAFQHQVINYFQKSACSVHGPPSQAAPQSPRTQWYAPRVTTFPCWPPWWSLTATLPLRGTRASGVTPSRRWRPAWRRASPWPSPRPLPPTTPAHPASPITLQPPRPLLHSQVCLHCWGKISRGYPVKIDQCCKRVCKQSDI